MTSGETQERVLTLEQRAWKGVRLCARSHICKPGVTDREFYVEIGYHYPRKQFCVEVQYTYLVPGKGACDFPDEKGTYGGIGFFGSSVADCLAWIEKEFNVKVNVDGPKIAQQMEWLRDLRKDPAI